MGGKVLWPPKIGGLESLGGVFGGDLVFGEHALYYSWISGGGSLILPRSLEEANAGRS